MKNLLKGIASLVLIATMILGVSVFAHADEKIDYTCGRNATWSYNEDTETLTITGKGTVISNWEWYDMEPKTIVIKEGIKKIGWSAFEGMKTVENVELPNSLEKIYSWAFGRTGITELEIPKNVKEIGSYAFTRTKIEEVTVNNTVEKIGAGVFYRCRQLKKVTWNYKKLPDYVFQGCEKLTEIKFNGKLNSIGMYAISNTAIKNFEMPETVTQISDHAFADCKVLESLTISKNVKTIPTYFILNTPALKKIAIPEGVETIKEYAFFDSSIETVTLPETLTTIEQNGFTSATKLTSIKIPSKVTIINDNTFEACESLKTVDLGNTITNIGEAAFKSCKALEGVTIPKSVETIEYEAFVESGIKTLVIEDGVKSIEYWAFNKCENLKTVTIGATVELVAENAFSNCSSLTAINVAADNFYYASVDGCLTNKAGTMLITVPAGKSGTFEMPAGVRRIEGTAFYGCTKITGYASTNNSYFVVEDGILYNVVKTTLFSCPSSKTGKIVIPNTVTYIAEAAFQNSKASSILIPDSVTTIGYCAFEYCENLTSITLPGSIKRIENAAFWDCKNLKRVVIGKGTQKINRNAFHGCESLKKITIPQSVAKIAKSAFSGCYGVTFYCKKSSAAMSYANRNWRINAKII